jgi:hypothetical protein
MSATVYHGLQIDLDEPKNRVNMKALLFGQLLTLDIQMSQMSLQRPQRLL